MCTLSHWDAARAQYIGEQHGHPSFDSLRDHALVGMSVHGASVCAWCKCLCACVSVFMCVSVNGVSVSVSLNGVCASVCENEFEYYAWYVDW